MSRDHTIGKIEEMVEGVYQQVGRSDQRDQRMDRVEARQEEDRRRIENVANRLENLEGTVQNLAARLARLEDHVLGTGRPEGRRIVTVAEYERNRDRYRGGNGFRRVLSVAEYENDRDRYLAQNQDRAAEQATRVRPQRNPTAAEVKEMLERACQQLNLPRSSAQTGSAPPQPSGQ